MRSLWFSMLFLPCLLGCGASRGKVTGQVRFQDSPLPGGILTFRSADPKQNPVSVELDEQGNYQATLPVGEIQVAVDNRQLKPPPARPPSGLAPPLPQKALDVLSKSKPPSAAPPAAKPATPAPTRGKYVAIPERYYTVDNSGLSITVGPGNQKHDIELK